MMVYVYLYGRLGNNLAQIGAAATLAARLRCDFAAVPVTSYWCPEPDNCYLNDYLKDFRKTIFKKVSFVDSVPDSVIPINEDVNWKCVSWDDLDISSDKDVLLNGVFLNANFVDRKICSDLFACPLDIKEGLIRKYKINTGVGSIVVRRGDYMNLPNFYAICGESYYRKAMKYLEFQCGIKRWLIISDDIEWCRGVFKGNKFTIVEEPPLIDLYLPTLCPCNIISNSTFAWWGAYLNSYENQVVCFPKPWYFLSFKSGESSIQNYFCAINNWFGISNFDFLQRLRGTFFYLKKILNKYIGDNS